jgi:hypothetical protein
MPRRTEKKWPRKGRTRRTAAPAETRPPEYKRVGIALEEFEPSASISLAQACSTGLLIGRGGKKVKLRTAMRWCNPAIGCRPQGQGGPVVVLPSVTWFGEFRIMPEWIARFYETLVDLGVPQECPL